MLLQGALVGLCKRCAQLLGLVSERPAQGLGREVEATQKPYEALGGRSLLAYVSRLALVSDELLQRLRLRRGGYKAITNFLLVWESRERCLCEGRKTFCEITEWFEVSACRSTHATIRG